MAGTETGSGEVATMRRAVWIMGLLALLGLGGWAGFMAWGRMHSPPAPVPEKAAAASRRSVVVTVAPVTLRSVSRSVQVVGSLYGRDEVPVSAKVEGRVQKIFRDVGDEVKPGDPLFDIDSTDYQLAVTEAERALELELAKIGLKEPPTANFDVNALPMVLRARAMEKNALGRRDRVVKLGGGASTAEERDSAQTEYEVARANTQQALLECQSVLAAVRHRAATLETARQKLADAHVRVPGTGDTRYVISQRLISEGEMVRLIPGLTSMHQYKLVADDSLKLQAAVPERHRRAVQVGQPVEISIEVYPGQVFRGQVARVNPAIDRTNRTFMVEIQVPNTDRKLAAGSFAKASIISKTDANARTVPEEAVVSFAGVDKVFVVRDGKASSVAVTTSASMTLGDQTWLEIEGDLKPGELVATSGQTQLVDGVAVKIREAGAEKGEKKAPVGK